MMIDLFVLTDIPTNLNICKHVSIYVKCYVSELFIGFTIKFEAKNGLVTAKRGLFSICDSKKTQNN